MNHNELFKSFKAITDNIRRSERSTPPAATVYSNRVAASGSASNGISAIGNTDSVPPTQSSQPTGSKWTLNALATSIKSSLNINPVNTYAIEDILRLPIKHQLILLSAITER